MELQVDCLKMSVQLLINTIQNVVNSSEDSGNNGVILVVGTNEGNTSMVIQDGVKGSGLDDMPIISLTSVWPNWGDVLGVQFLEPPFPPRLMVLLENCSPELLSDYIDSGILEFFEARRTRLITLAWTAQHAPIKFRELSVFRKIVVPEPEMEVPSSAPPQSHEEAIVLETFPPNGGNSQRQGGDEEVLQNCCIFCVVLSLFGICKCFC